MATTYTTNALLQKPAPADRHWDVPLNANSDFLDGISAIGRLLVTPAEAPSTTLNVRVTSGAYTKADGTTGVFNGTVSYALAPSTTTYLWLTDAGVLTAGAAFPTTAHVRLAHVVTGPTSVQSVADDRLVSRTAGTGLGFVLKAGDTMTGTLAVVSPTSGVSALVVNPSTPAVGFFGSSPATQAPALAPVTDNSTGVASNTVVDVGPSYSQAQIDANFATLAAKVNALIAAMKRHGLMSS
jgi:hypothetical protein